jgi:hypothetical protein
MKMAKSKKEKEYFKKNPDDDMLDFILSDQNEWKKFARGMQKSLEKEHWSIGSPLIGQHGKDGEILFRYFGGRVETEFVNELQIICSLDNKANKNIAALKLDNLYLTGYLPLIFKKSDRVYVVEYQGQVCAYESQYGVLTRIFDKITGQEVEETYIGYNFVVQIEEIDRSKIPTWGKYFKK